MSQRHKERPKSTLRPLLCFLAYGGWGQRQNAIDLLFDHFARHVADDLVGNLAALEDQQGRNSTNSIAGRRGAILVHIDFDYFELAGVGRCKIVDGGGDRPARAAPDSPKDHQHWLLRW